MLLQNIHNHVWRAVFTHGPKGPGPMASNFQGLHIKKNWDRNMVCGKKRREKVKGDLSWKHHVLSFVSFLCCICLHITEYEQMGGGRGAAKFSCAQGRKKPKYGPACMYQTIWCHNSNHIMNPHHCEHLKSIPKIIKNWNVDGNVTMGKLNYRRAVYILT
jgi:hypothetical protein